MKAYWNSLTKDQQVRLAKNVGSTRDYLRLVFSGHKNAGFNLAIRLEQETAGEITRSELRPDIYQLSVKQVEA